MNQIKLIISLTTSAIFSFLNIIPTHAEESIRNIDFNNLNYYLEEGGMGPSGQISLNQGMYRDKESSMSYVELTNIYYRDFNGDSQEDALVVLIASGGGSGVSSHAYIFIFNSGKAKVIFYEMNFIEIRPFGNGFVLNTTSPLATGEFLSCDNFLIRTNAIDITLYEWNGIKFSPAQKTTVKGTEICQLFIR